MARDDFDDAGSADRDSPWPMTSGPLLLREATEIDIETMLTFRRDEQVNWFMLQTEVDPEAFRRQWLAAPGSSTDFSCVEVVNGMGQPGMPEGSEGMIGYIVDPRHAGRGYATHLAKGVQDSWHAQLGWIDGFSYGLLASEWRAASR